MPDPQHPAPDAATHGLAAHLDDAIRLNRSRRALYRERGGLRAEVLSRALVASERLLRPAARALDRAAARHAPLPILAADLTDLDQAPPPTRPLPAVPTRSTPDEPARRCVWNATRALRRRDLAAAGRHLRRLVAALQAREAATGRHRALGVHVVESAALMATRGADYALQSGGATVALSRRLVAGHLALVPFALVLDRLAAPLHAAGVGLFVNDLPPIPHG